MTTTQKIISGLIAFALLTALAAIAACAGVLLVEESMAATAPVLSLWRISADGIDYGTYEGRDEDDALDAMLGDAGYDSREALPEHIDPAAFEVEEVSAFSKKAESALNKKFGQGRKSFSHRRDVEFEIDGPGSIPGAPERPGAYAVQLLPEGELEDGEAGFFGHTVEIDGETFQVNWLW